MAKPSDFPSKFRFNPKLGKTGRYIDAKGKMVSQKAITKEMEQVILGVKTEMGQLSRRLRSKSISAQEWYDGMRGRMKLIHGLHASIAKGGWAQMTPSDWGAVGAITKKQYAFLNKFALEILDGSQPLNGHFLRRTGMYADASRGTGEDMLRREAARNGYTEERRVLGAADHCTTRGGLEGCVELAAKGWQPIGTSPRIGETPCRTHCHCTFQFR